MKETATSRGAVRVTTTMRRPTAGPREVHKKTGEGGRGSPDEGGATCNTHATYLHTAHYTLHQSCEPGEREKGEEMRPQRCVCVCVFVEGEGAVQPRRKRETKKHTHTYTQKCIEGRTKSVLHSVEVRRRRGRPRPAQVAGPPTDTGARAHERNKSAHLRVYNSENEKKHTRAHSRKHDQPYKKQTAVRTSATHQRIHGPRRRESTAAETSTERATTHR